LVGTLIALIRRPGRDATRGGLGHGRRADPAHGSSYDRESFCRLSVVNAPCDRWRQQRRDIGDGVDRAPWIPWFKAFRMVARLGFGRWQSGQLVGNRVAVNTARSGGRQAGPVDCESEIEAIRRSGLFDSVWYAERTPEAASFPDAIAHYVAVGARAGLAPHPMFDVAWYLDANPDCRVSGLSPMGHFILRGEAAGASVSAIFDLEWYRQQDPSLASQQEGLLHHFLRIGAAEGLSPHPAFDPAYYRSQRPDIANSATNPLTHFLEVGGKEGASPNPFFDLAFYAASVPGLAETGINPLVHFLTRGAREGRSPHPDIDLTAYQAAHPDAPRDLLGAYRYLLTHEREATFFLPGTDSPLALRHAGLLRSGLFVPRTYLALNEDLEIGEAGAFEHFVRRGLPEGRTFTNTDTIARLIARMAPELTTDMAAAHAAAGQALAGVEAQPLAAWFRDRSARIGVFCNTEGNFFMRDIAVLLLEGLRALGIAVELRDETAARDERFDLRIFVAPHEFFYLGRGQAWRDMAGAPGSVLYNVEQPQTQWFCRGFQVMLKAPLVLDINFQTAAILRRIGIPAVHFMPGYLPSLPAAEPVEDVSDIDLIRGYDFARKRHNWRENDSLDTRPIDILFIGAGSPRRDKALARLLELTDDYRFLCVYRQLSAPLTTRQETATSARINCALGQRTKIVLNIYRDWIGYFDFSRAVQYGFWQGAAVVTDPSLPHPIYQPNVHFLQESTRHMGELIRWLLETRDGRLTLDKTRHAAFAQASGLGSMNVAMTPVLGALKALLGAGR
jgi:hypothetical protein